MLIGLTGGIATGKTLVARALEHLGAVVVDADMIAREIIEPGKLGYKKVVEAFGGDILKENPYGAPFPPIDRLVLGKLVFSDDECLKKLNDIMHPEIRKEIEARMERLRAIYVGKKTIVLNAPLLIELESHKALDTVIVVICDEDKQIERAMKRDNLTEAEVRARMRAQMPLDEKVKVANYIIDNNGTEDEVEAKVKKVYEDILRDVTPKPLPPYVDKGRKKH